LRSLQEIQPDFEVEAKA